MSGEARRPTIAAHREGDVLLEGKRLVITGVLTDGSIAWHTARVAQLAGAEIVLTGFGRGLRLTERSAKRLPRPADVIELDVNDPAHMEALVGALGERWGAVDGALHAIAYAPEDALGGNFLNTPPESASTAFLTSAFSYKTLAVGLRPLLQAAGGGALVTLDFDNSQAWPAYGLDGGCQVGTAVSHAIPRKRSRRGQHQGERSLGRATEHGGGEVDTGFRSLRVGLERPGTARMGYG